MLRIEVEVVSGAMFLVPVPDRRASTLFEVMKKYIRAFWRVWC